MPTGSVSDCWYRPLAGAMEIASFLEIGRNRSEKTGRCLAKRRGLWYYTSRKAPETRCVEKGAWTP